MKSKEYKISSIRDMINCTNADNIDNFIMDLKAVIMSVHLVNEMSDCGIKCDEFTWIDDEEHKIAIEIKEKNQ